MLHCVVAWAQWVHRERQRKPLIATWIEHGHLDPFAIQCEAPGHGSKDAGCPGDTVGEERSFTRTPDDVFGEANKRLRVFEVGAARQLLGYEDFRFRLGPDNARTASRNISPRCA